MKAYYADSLHELRCMPKIKMDHIKLNSYSVMKVYLAAQVLSKTVSIGLKELVGSETVETSHFCEIVDKCFDCFNIK